MSLSPRLRIGLPAVVMLALLSGSVWLKAASPRPGLLIVDPPVPVDAFRLRDQHGKLFTTASLYRHWTAVLKIPTHCTARCPGALHDLSKDYDELIERYRFTNLQFALLEETPIDTSLDRRFLRLRGKVRESEALAAAGELSFNIFDPLGRQRATLVAPYTRAELISGLVELRERYGADCCFATDEKRLETVIIHGDRLQLERVK